MIVPEQMMMISCMQYDYCFRISGSCGRATRASMPLDSCTCWILAGEEPVTGIVAGVTQSESTTIISCVEDERLEFQVRDFRVQPLHCAA